VVACSTCHVVVHPDFFKKLPKADDEELDMLDLAFGLTEWFVSSVSTVVVVHVTECRSRLGCQIKMTPELNNIVVAVPEETRDVRGS
jgi:ferredoxin